VVNKLQSINSTHFGAPCMLFSGARC